MLRVLDPPRLGRSGRRNPAATASSGKHRVSAAAQGVDAVRAPRTVCAVRTARRHRREQSAAIPSAAPARRTTSISAAFQIDVAAGRRADDRNPGRRGIWRVKTCFGWPGAPAHAGSPGTKRPHALTAHLDSSLYYRVRSAYCSFMRTRKRRGRQRHYNEPGHAHELTFSCFHGFPFLRADRTCSWLAESIEKARVALDFAVWAYVFMPDHAHLLICPRQPDYNISEILRSIKNPVSRAALSWLRENSPDWLNRVRMQRGKRVEYHFWQSGGGYDRNVDEPRTLRSMIEYIHLNPVRKGLVTKAADWNWSSAAWFQTSVPRCPLVPNRIPPEWGA